MANPIMNAAAYPLPEAWYAKPCIITTFNAVVTLALMALYGGSLGRADWKDRDLALGVSAPFMGTIYLLALVWMVCDVAKKKRWDVHAFNAYLSTATGLATTVVFVVMSWMEDETDSQRAWSYASQLLAVVFGAASVYLNATMALAKAQREIYDAWRGAKAQLVAQPSSAPLAPPAADRFDDAQCITVLVGSREVQVCEDAYIQPGLRGITLVLGPGQVATVPQNVDLSGAEGIWVKRVGDDVVDLKYIANRTIAITC